MHRFLKHLEGRGFDVEERTDTVWFVSHDSYPSMFLVTGVGGFLLRAYFGGMRPAPRESPLQQLNRLNREAVASRFFLDDDQDTVVEAWHPSIYEAAGFEAFLEAWLRDIGTLLQDHKAAERHFDA